MEPVISERGFGVFLTMEDDYGAEVRVVESSSAEDRKLWIFVTGGGTARDGNINDGSIHLNLNQARSLAAALSGAADWMMANRSNDWYLDLMDEDDSG